MLIDYRVPSGSYGLRARLGYQIAALAGEIAHEQLDASALDPRAQLSKLAGPGNARSCLDRFADHAVLISG
jgi:hypothetical protein